MMCQEAGLPTVYCFTGVNNFATANYAFSKFRIHNPHSTKHWLLFFLWLNV